MRPPSVPVTQKVSAVKVHRVVVDGAEVDEPDANPLAQLADQRRDIGAGAAVEREEVELHRHRVGDRRSRQDCPLLDDAGRNRGRRAARGLFGMDDEQAHHPHPVLHGVVRVVEECSVLVQGELVGVRSRRDGSEAGSGPARRRSATGISRPCQWMPVDSGSSLWTTIRTRSPCTASIVGPGIVPLKPQTSMYSPGRNSRLDGHAVEVEFLDAVDHRPGQFLGEVGHDDRDRRLRRRGGAPARACHDRWDYLPGRRRSGGRGDNPRRAVPTMFVFVFRRRFLGDRVRFRGHQPRRRKRAALQERSPGRLVFHHATSFRLGIRG